MAVFAADFIPLSGTDLFNMSGEMPPQLRVIMNVPSDVDAGLFKWKRGSDDIETRERFENQDRLKSILVERYRNAAMACLIRFRQNKKLGIVSQVHSQIELEPGVRMEYDSLWGREFVTLYFSEELVRKLVDVISGGDLCMLVLYKDKQLAYMPMKSVSKIKSNAKFSKRTVNESSWGKPEWWTGGMGEFFLYSCQIKPEKNTSWLYTQLKFEKGKLSIPKSPETYHVYVSTKGLDKSAETSTPITDKGDPLLYGIYQNVSLGWKWPVDDWRNAYKKWWAPPVINATATKLFNDRGDEFEIVKKEGLKRTKKGSAEVDEYAWYNYQACAVVGDKGERYSFTNTLFINTNIGGFNYKWSYYTITKRQNDIINYEYNGWPDVGTGGSAYDNMYYCGPGDSDVQGKQYTFDAWEANHPSITMKAPTPVYTKVPNPKGKGGTDKIECKMLSVTCSGSSPGGSHPDDGFTASMNFAGFSQSISYAAHYTQEILYTQVKFPPSLGDTKGKMYLIETKTASVYQNDEYLDTKGKLNTPYGLTISLECIDFSFDGWLHASDGENVLQGFVIQTAIGSFKRYLFLNGDNVGDKIAGAIGCSLTDIRSIMFDIKLADIQKLK